jgi:hydrogenase/urease accessory protein HupE
MRFAKTLALTALATLLPVAAYAHPGHDVVGFSAGFGHPFSGLDHILAMVAVGLWAALAAMLAEERRLVAREARDGRTAS